jgi:uncharacterized Zn finger protein (UPF0148 family)
LLGGYTVAYECPKCSTALKSPLDEAGTADSCPQCGTQFVVPGTEERDRIRQEGQKAKWEQQQKTDAARRQKERHEASERELHAAKKHAEQAARQSPARPIASPQLAASFSTKQLRPPPGDVIVSSGPICAEYNVLGLVVGFASKAEGCTGVISVDNVYRTALERLIEGARARDANGLIHVNFQNRVAAQMGCGVTRQVFEVFAWGTAIRF